MGSVGVMQVTSQWIDYPTILLSWSTLVASLLAYQEKETDGVSQEVMLSEQTSVGMDNSDFESFRTGGQSKEVKESGKVTITKQGWSRRSR